MTSPPGRPPDGRLFVLLPAYEEAESLAPLLADLGAVLAGWPDAPATTVVVVDDGSRDGTAEAARAAAGGLDVTVLVHETNRGLGAAVRTGIDHVLSVAADDDGLVVLDADHTHPPDRIPLLIAEARAGAHLVIASRYRPGARVLGLDPLRRAVSRLASWLLRVTFPAGAARDYTCGYRYYRVGLLRWGRRRYGAALLDQEGFSVMVDLLLLLRRRARRITEVPLVLRYDRKRGASKMRLARTAWSTLRLMGRRLVGDPRGP